jgi:hypothetical protein
VCVSIVASLAHGQAAQINKIGAEEFVSSIGMDRPSVATDSKSQPHFVADCGGNPNFMKFHRVNGKWTGGIFATGSPRGPYSASRLYIGQIEIDGKDRAWISCKFGCKEYGWMLGQGTWLFRDVANDGTPPQQFFRYVNVYKGMGVITTDAKYPDQGVVLGTHGNYNILNASGAVIKEGSINAGHGGEKVRARIASYAPRFATKDDKRTYPDGIWHTAMNGSSMVTASYQNSARFKAGSGPIPWAAHSSYPIMGDDYHHPGLCTDLSDQNVAYIATVFYGKLCINIWNGSRMLFNPASLKVLDYNVGFEARHAVAIAPAPGTDGGAFFFWSRSGSIYTCYVSKKGVAGKIMYVTAGRTAAATTDRDGNIHLVYATTGARYRKIYVSTLDTIAPKGTLADRTPTFRWTNTKAASYTIEISRDGSKILTQPVSGAYSWTPGTDLAVGNYSWRVKEGGASSPWSSSEKFEVPPLTPTPVAPNTRFASVPASPDFEWTNGDLEATQFTLALYKDGDLLDTYIVPTNGTTDYDVAAPAPLQAGVYTWTVKSVRKKTNNNVSSEPSEPLAFQVGVPSAPVITTPTSDDRFKFGPQTIGFSWDPADGGATAYRLRVVHNGSTFHTVFNVVDTNQTITANFWPGWYTALVLPQNADGDGLLSEPVTFEVTRRMVPGFGKTLDQDPDAFVWTRSKDATRYLVKLSLFNAASRKYEVIRERWVDQSAWNLSPSWNPSFDFANGAYRWSVTDYDGKKAHYTSTTYFQIKVPGAPDLVEPIGVVPSSSVELVWTDPTDEANEFQVEVWQGSTKLRDTGFKSAASFLKSAGVFSKPVIFTATEAGAITWRVQGRNGKGLGPWGVAKIVVP